MSYSGSQETKPAIQPPAGAYRDEEERLEVVPGMSQNIVWALKIPKFLLERWEQVEEAGVELGTLVVDSSSVMSSSERPSHPFYLVVSCKEDLR
jgi:hypothetical protein